MNKRSHLHNATELADWEHFTHITLSCRNTGKKYLVREIQWAHQQQKRDRESLWGKGRRGMMQADWGRPGEVMWRQSWNESRLACCQQRKLCWRAECCVGRPYTIRKKCILKEGRWKEKSSSLQDSHGLPVVVCKSVWNKHDYGFVSVSRGIPVM